MVPPPTRIASGDSADDHHHATRYPPVADPMSETICIPDI
jgi:hypothetical protein